MAETLALRGRSPFLTGAFEDRGILFPVSLVWIFLLALLALRGINALRPSSYGNNLLLYASSLLFILIPLGAATLWRDRPDRPIAHLARAAAERGLWARLLRGAPMMLALILFMPAFSAMKSAIPLFNAYTWDPTFIAADMAIHGTDPWRLLQPVLGHPWITAAIAAAYHLWILLIYVGGVFFCFFTNDRVLRARYFLCYFALWTVIGVFLATTLASVGPCFVAPILGNDHFAEQMAYLHSADSQAPVMVLAVQQQLLDWHLSGNHGLGRGITAMPSMHVALALLFALAMYRLSRPLGWAFGAFFVVILIGSVHLAYHYAVDGYVSIIATIIIWKLSAPLARMIVR